MSDVVSVNGAAIETPGDDASLAQIEAIKKQALGQQNVLAAAQGQADAAERKSAGAAAEGKHKEAASEESAKRVNNGTAQGEVATELIGQNSTVAAAVSVADNLYSDLKRSGNASSISSKDAKKLGANNPSSFEEGTFKKMKNASADPIGKAIMSTKAGKNIFEKANLAKESLKGQGVCVKSWQVDEKTAISAADSKKLAFSHTYGNEQKLAQVAAAEVKANAKLAGPTPGGFTHNNVERPNPPNFNKEKSDTQDDWMGN